MQKMDHRGQIKQPITYFKEKRQQNLSSYKVVTFRQDLHISFYKREKSFEHLVNSSWVCFMPRQSRDD